MIAAEALFASDTDGAELTFRLSLRGAAFLRVENVPPSSVRRFLRNAYNARSKVAHGSAPKKLTDLTGEEVDMPSFIADLDRLLRLAVEQATWAVARGDSPASDARLDDLLDDP